MRLPKNTALTLKHIVENMNEISPTFSGGNKPPKMTTEQKRKLQEMAACFEKYGEVLRNEVAIMESAKSMNELCELAQLYATNECEDVFSENIVQRDMKEVKKRVMEYTKISQECYARMQELRVAHEDIGHTLGRYYSLTSTPQPGGTYRPVNKGERMPITTENDESEDYDINDLDPNIRPPYDSDECDICGSTSHTSNKCRYSPDANPI